MALVKPLDLVRFQRTQSGLIEFAMLVEQASPRRRELILKRVRFEAPDFLELAMKRVVFFNELPFLEETVLAEILHKISPKILAYALKDSPKAFSAAILKHLSYPQMKQVLDEQEKVLETASKAFILGAQHSILKHARELEKKGRFVLELHDCPRFRKKSIL